MRVIRLTLSTAWASALNFAIAVGFLVWSFEPEKSGGQSAGFLVMTALFFVLGRRRLREYLRRRDAALDSAPPLPEDARRESPLRWLKRAILGGRLGAALNEPASIATVEVDHLATRSMEHHLERRLRSVAILDQG